MNLIYNVPPAYKYDTVVSSWLNTYTTHFVWIVQLAVNSTMKLTVFGSTKNVKTHQWWSIILMEWTRTQKL